MTTERIADFGFRIRNSGRTLCGFSLAVDVDRDESGRVDVDVSFDIEDGDTAEQS